MDLTKKSLGWLKPIVLSKKDALKFKKSVDKQPSTATLNKQRELFKFARNLMEREQN